MRGVLLLITALLPLVAVPAAASPRIVAIGDIHGDHAAWSATAIAAGLIDAGGRWTGGNSILVQTGDVPDRGADTLKILRDLMRLQREARRQGGRVHVLVGNHEAMNITGDLRYVSDGEYAAFIDRNSERRRQQIWQANRSAIEQAYRATAPDMEADAIRDSWFAATPPGRLEHRAAWAPDGEIGRWVIANPAVLLLDGTVFVHAGISASYADRSIADLNAAVAAALKARDDSELSIIHDPQGPLWYRGYAPERGAPLPATAAAELDGVLQSYGAHRMVIGHSPQLGGIAMLHGGRLAIIDTGMSSAYGGIPGYLEIIDGSMTAHAVARPAQSTP